MSYTDSYYSVSPSDCSTCQSGPPCSFNTHFPSTASNRYSSLWYPNFEYDSTDAPSTAELYRNIQPFPCIRRRDSTRPRKSNKKHYYFAHPTDGKRKGTLGRIKDALTGQGPDVFIIAYSTKSTPLRDRPKRWRWTGQPPTPDEIAARMEDRSVRVENFMPVIETWWTEKARRKRPVYTLRRRRYEGRWKQWDNPEWLRNDMRSSNSVISSESLSVWYLGSG